VERRPRPGLDGGLRARRPGDDRGGGGGRGQPPWWDADVVAHERRTFDIAVLQVKPRNPFGYQPGQSISLETELRPGCGATTRRPTRPGPTAMELHVKARDGGPVSSALVRQVGVGDVLRLGPPLGHLVLDDDSDRDLLLVAGGMGLAPLKALVDQVARFGPARGSTCSSAFPHRGPALRPRRPRAAGQEHPWLTVTYAVSDDKESRLEHGDIGDVVDRHGPWNSRDVYVAGPAVMVEDTGPGSCQHGVPPERIRSEVFAPSRPGPSVDGEVTE
jgi:NAD(P)H-flavin reductase